ncbi:amidohydrolase family protein [Chloroflexota bacterium]
MSGNKTKVIDVHYHVLSPNLAKEIAECVHSRAYLDLSKNVSITPDGYEIPLVNEEDQLNEADRVGIDTLVMTMPDPSLIVGLPDSTEQRLTLSQTINNYLASLCQRFPGRFMALADIPQVGLNELAIQEMRRALNELGLHGINLFTRYDGKPLDAPEFRPFFEEANRQQAVIYIHPTCQMDPTIMDYHMYILVRFPYETTLTIARLAYAGVLEQFPDISFILSHAGGTIPFLWWRLDYGHVENYPSCRDHIQVPPSKYLKRCYFDTALSDTDSLMLAYKRVGGDHILFGTDAPYRIEALSETIKMVEAMDINEEVKGKILGGNALALMHRRTS